MHSRQNYEAPSHRFSDWVSSFGFERTFLGRIFSWLDRDFRIRELGGLFLFCLCVSIFIFWDEDPVSQLREGEIAKLDVKSPINFTVVDQLATEEKRKAAENAVPSLFDYEPQLMDDLFSSIYLAFRNMRNEVRKIDWPTHAKKREEAIKDFFVHKEAFERDLGRKVSDLDFEWLVERQFAASIENVLIRLFVRWSSLKIADGPSALLSQGEQPVLLRQMKDGKVTGEELALAKDITDLSLAAPFHVDDIKGFEDFSKKDRTRILRVAKSMLPATVSFNNVETQARKKKVREDVLPVQVSVKKNQTVVNAGSVVQPAQIAMLQKMSSLKQTRQTGLVTIMTACLLMTLLLVLFSFLKRFSQIKVYVETKDLFVMAIVSTLVLVLTKGFLFITNAAFMSRYSLDLIPSAFFLYLAPVAAGPMLIGLLISSGAVVLLFTVFLVTALTLMVEGEFAYAIVALVSGFAAAKGVYACKKRNDIYLAGLRTGFVSALMIAFVTLIGRGNAPDLVYQLTWLVPAGLASGVLSSMVAMITVPLIEEWFNYTTDVKLLELSSLNHPLMKEMIVKAPGTYHHSLVVGSMCEAAAEEIGANALLAKVMAYYHDIGKMEHAQYFIENQKQGVNPHDHISPNMSKTILVAHVKDGVEMGVAHKLGKPIIDGILQHHGTTLISFFYNKALEEQDEDIDHIEADDFRYPGPKPQFKEAALVMLADSIEAAARSLDEPTPARLQNIVKNIIQSKFLDGQLEECNLSLRDLSMIDSCFMRVLLGIYHQRIDYPQGGRSKVAKIRSQVGKDQSA